MYQTIYIIEKEQDVHAALTHLKDKVTKVGFAVTDKDLTLPEKISTIEVEINQDLTYKTYQYMMELIRTQPDLDYFLSKYKDFYPMIKTKTIIETLKEMHDVNHFVIPNHLYNQALVQELPDVQIELYATQHDNKFSNLSLKKKIGEWLLQSQHKTMIYPNIVLRKEFYRSKKSYAFTKNSEKNVLLIVSSHINYPRVLLPFEEVLVKKGYRIFYLAQTKRVANYVRRYSQQSVHTIQEFVGISDLLRRKAMNIHINSEEKPIQAFKVENQSKLSEFDKYYRAFQKIIKNNSIDLIMTADDVEPFGRGFVRYAKISHIKTVTVQHGYIADQLNYSSTISDYMLTWDDISTEVITTLKTSQTKVQAIGPPHLSQVNKVKRSNEDIALSWFPVPNEYMNKQSNGKKVLDGIRHAIQSLSTDKSVKLHIKLHPFDSIINYQNSVAQLAWEDNVQVEIYQHDKNPIDVILSSDIVIGINTSVVYEAYLLGTPVIAYNPLQEELNPLLLSYYEVVCQEQAELQRNLRTLLNKGHNLPQQSGLIDWERVKRILFEESVEKEKLNEQKF